MKKLLKSIFTSLIYDTKKIVLDYHLYILIAIYAAFFGRFIFIMNDISISLLAAFWVDHGMMLDSMLKMLQLETLYNQTQAYQSSYYGWTYFFISFLFLAPIKLVASLMLIRSYAIVFVGLKILHFFYGLLSCMSFYFLMTRFTSKFRALLLSLILMLASPLTEFCYLFHPETIGVFFLNLGCIYLVDLLKQKSNTKAELLVKYYIIVLFLTLATLSKPTFFLIAAPLYLSLIVVYIEKSKQSILAFLKSLKFWYLLLETLCFSVAIFFVINPFFFLNFSRSIKLQIGNASFFSNYSLAYDSWFESLMVWISFIGNRPLLLASVLSTGIVFIYFGIRRSLNKFSHNAHQNHFKWRQMDLDLYLFIQFTILLNILFTTFSMRMFIDARYLIPILPLMLVNLSMVTSKITEASFIPTKTRNLVFTLILAAISYGYLKTNLNNMNSFYHYQENVKYKIYSYIQNNIPDGSVILYDQFVGIPNNKKIIPHHYWNYKSDELKNINAEYIIFNPEFKYHDKYHDNLIILREIVQTQDYKKIATIGTIEIWQKNR
jgi:hypothetical protein